MRAAILIMLLWATGSADARTWSVPDEVPTVGAAIDSATAGDTVELAAGVYQESSLEFYLKPSLTIRAADPASGATLDAGEAGRIFSAGLCDSLTLEDLTLTGGLT